MHLQRALLMPCCCYQHEVVLNVAYGLKSCLLKLLLLKTGNANTVQCDTLALATCLKELQLLKACRQLICPEYPRRHRQESMC